MPDFLDNAHVNKYVSPMLHLAVKNLEDNFTQFMGKVNAGARNAKGVDLNLLVNDWTVESGFNVDATFGDGDKVADKKSTIEWSNGQLECTDCQKVI